jgi:hypothetical protein
MANQVHNIALGQVVAYYRRVDENDPSTAELYVIAWAASDTDDAIKDADTVAAIEALASTAEATNSGYSRKVLTDADVVAFAADDTNNRVDLDIPDQTWTAVAAGSNWTDIGIAYGLNGGADSAKVPLTWHDFAVTPSGTDIVAQVAAAGFFRAS